MEQKATRLIIIGLVILLIGSIFFGFQFFNEKQQIIRDRDQLKEEAAVLSKKAEEGMQENRRLQGRISELSQSVEIAAREKEEFRNKYSDLKKANESLDKQLRALSDKSTQESRQVEPQAGDAYWAGIFSQKKSLEMQIENVRSELKNSQLTVEQLTRDNNEAKLEVTNLTREKQDIARQFEFIQKQTDYNKKMIEAISLELVIERNDKIKIQDALKSIKNENGVLRRQLKNINVKKASLEQKVVEYQEKNKVLESRFTEMDVLLNDKMIQIDKMNKEMALSRNSKAGSSSADSVELPPIVVRPQQEDTSGSKTPIAGKVLAVNRDNNFVIVDLGIEGGAKSGDIFRVYNKQDKSIATVEVVETRKSISACDIKKESQPITIGDSIR